MAYILSGMYLLFFVVPVLILSSIVYLIFAIRRAYKKKLILPQVYVFRLERI